MSDQQQAAATLAELQEACPGASNDFLVEQIERGASAASAAKAHMSALTSEIATLKAQQQNRKGARGVDPIGGDANPEASADAYEGLGANEFARIEINNLVAKGMPRDRAANRVFAQNPGLREAMVAEANA